MKNLRHTSSLIQCTTITLALPAIGNKGVVGSEIKKIFLPFPSRPSSLQWIKRIERKVWTRERHEVRQFFRQFPNCKNALKRILH